MKNIISIITLSLFILLSSSTILANSSDVKTGPGDPGQDPEISGDTPLGAPIGGGTLILLALGAAYGGKKLYQLKDNPEK